MKQILSLFFLFACNFSNAQYSVKGEVRDRQSGDLLSDVLVTGKNGKDSIYTDSRGKFMLTNASKEDSLQFSLQGYRTEMFGIANEGQLKYWLSPINKEMNAVVVTGTLRPVSKLESPISVEVYHSAFFKKNPAPSLFESLQQVNGVRPQLNCSVCNTGDIHINGLEGPYTMVTIDGMPIVSSLGSVYGLFGIPAQMIDRVEIVKGPASGLYGPEAIGGLINVITKSAEKAPRVSVNAMTSNWLEHSLDIGFKKSLGKKTDWMMGADYFRYLNKEDRNRDGFTDVALQHRISVFQKLGWQRKYNRQASVAARYFYEDRWGGEMNWSPRFRGTDSIYGESIYTKRWELMGKYQLPVQENINLSVSATSHQQNSWYGATPYMGDQRIFFSQLVWDRSLGNSHQLLLGAALRYNYYDDNSTATIDTLSKQNQPEKAWIPGLFVQDEWKINPQHTLLMGARIDHHPLHGNIFTPRFAWRWKGIRDNIFRLNLGTGFRVVSLFTEDHAALTGARSVEITEALKPEKSYNANANYTQTFQMGKNSLQLESSAWYSHFTNQIIADYDTDPDKIIYQNLNGYSRSYGWSGSLTYGLGHRLKFTTAFTWQDVSNTRRDNLGNKITQRQMLTERWSGVWQIGYSIPEAALQIDYTGNIYGPMRLPLLSATDPRPDHSPVWSIQNIQVTKKWPGNWELFAGVKNLLNWTPARNIPFLIARAGDPFDKNVLYNADGSIKPTADNPYALSFDPSYIYAPNQGLRFFAGMRWMMK